MALFDKFKKKPADPKDTPPPPPEPAATAGEAGAAAPKPAAPEYLEATDAFGRKVRFTRDEYRQRVLPELIKAHGRDPAQLTNVIMQGLQQGFAKDLVGAANRLVVIDKEPERALTVLAVVQRDAGDLEAAEFTLQELQQKRPDSPAVPVGMAMLAERRGDLARCEQLLWQAIEKDPNHADAVHGWLSVRHRQVGDDGYRAEIEKLAARPGSWRARLWLARLDLQQGHPEAAIAVYRELLAATPPAPDVLLMAATDLLNARQHDALTELVEPRFAAGQHHPQIGLVLLHHLAATKRHGKGAALLHSMHVHYGHMLGEQLQPFTAEFDRQRLGELPPVEQPANPRVSLYRLEWPAFCSGLADPQWLLPKKQAGHKQVLLLALSLDGQASFPPGQEEDLGRLVRSVPLFLAEHVWLASPHRGTVALPMTEPGGWAVMGQPWPEEQLVQHLPEAERPHSLLVTGVLRVDGEQRRIDLWVYDCGKQARIGHAAAEGAASDFGAMLLQLLAELWPLIGGPQDHEPPVGDPAFWHRHAEGLAQHAALVVTRAGAMPKERLYGERYIAQWLQTTAMVEPRWQPGTWLYSSALCLLHELGSPVALEHARAVGELFRQSPPNSPFARLAVRPLRAVGLDNFWQARRSDIVAAAGGDLGYAEWLERAEAMR